MIERHKLKASPIQHTSLRSESSLSSFRIMQDSDAEQFYSPSDIDEGHGLVHEYRTAKHNYPLLHKATKRAYNIRSYKSPIDDIPTLASNDFCDSCIKYMHKNEDLRKQNRFISEKCIATERHLKQYDNLLQIKDTRLEQQELELKKDMEAFEIEKENFSIEKKAFEEEREDFYRDHGDFSMQTERIDEKFEELEEKKIELTEILKEIERRNYELKRREENQDLIEQEYKEKLLISRENDIQRLMDEVQRYRNESTTPVFDKSSDDIAYRKQKFKEKKQEMNILALQLKDMRIKIEEEQKANYVNFEQRMRSLEESERKLAIEKENLEFTQERVAEELESIDQLKIILKTQMENLEKERKLLHENYEDRIREIDCNNKESKFGIKVHRKKSSIDDMHCYTEPKELTFRKNSLDAENLINEYENQCKDCEVRLKDTEEKYYEAEFRYKEQEGKIRDFEEKISEYEGKIRESEYKNKEFEGKWKKYQLEIDFYKNQLSTIETKREEQLRLATQLCDKINKVKGKKKNLKSRVLELEKSLKSPREGKSTRSYRDENCVKCSELDKKNADLLCKISDLNEKIVLLEQKNEEIEGKNAELVYEIEKFRAESMVMEEKVFTLENCSSEVSPDAFTMKIKVISEELEGKLAQVRIKESELIDMEKHLLQEKESIESAAQFVKSINEDLNIQKQILKEEKDAFDKQKMRLFDIDKRQQERAKLLINKQDELTNLRDKLLEREKSFMHKGRKLTMPDLSGLDLSFLDS
ncbi:hypothetical protein SteCoe_14236 [Stentor coeruleus]|uniref:Uncharacterized protein n=1 Tax=Stentor coeruleus TaxID=5963 RepID=A0A1R2C6N9_9CILI|nr:hypothetical protein SteCoe_14236 [Stentor coeruleus]